MFSSPCGNRTRLSGLRGRDHRQIDQRAMLSVRRAGVEPAQPEAADLQSVGLTDAQPTHGFRWRRRELNPQTRRFELRRFAGLRTAPCLSKAPSTGFEVSDLLRDGQASTPGCSARAWLSSGRRGSRTPKAHRRPLSRRLPSPVGLSFRGYQLRWEGSNLQSSA